MLLRRRELLILSTVRSPSANRVTGISHFDGKYAVEKHLQASGVTYTIIAPASPHGESVAAVDALESASREARHGIACQPLAATNQPWPTSGRSLQSLIERAVTPSSVVASISPGMSVSDGRRRHRVVAHHHYRRPPRVASSCRTPRRCGLPTHPPSRRRGPKRRTEADPGLLPALEGLVDPVTRGDPGSPLRWTCKSTRRLAFELTRRGHPVCTRSDAAQLQDAGYSLQDNRKTREGTAHPDRNAQFEYINASVTALQSVASPSCRWTPRRRNSSVISATAVGSGSPGVSRRKSAVTTLWTRSWARRSPTASMTSTHNPGGG